MNVDSVVVAIRQLLTGQDVETSNALLHHCQESSVQPTLLLLSTSNCSPPNVSLYEIPTQDTWSLLVDLIAFNDPSVQLFSISMMYRKVIHPY